MAVYVVRGTKKFLQRHGPPARDLPEATTTLGDWYVNALMWRPQVALFVNASTFLPVFMPLAPAAGVVKRFPAALAAVLDALGIDPRLVAHEVGEMTDVVVTSTASRQVLGVMNEFVFMAEHGIGRGSRDPRDLLGLSVWLADTIVGPLTKDDGYAPLGALHRHVRAHGGLAPDSRA